MSVKRNVRSLGSVRVTVISSRQAQAADEVDGANTRGSGALMFAVAFGAQMAFGVWICRCLRDERAVYFPSGLSLLTRGSRTRP
jgi:hypothetical protein